MAPEVLIKSANESLIYQMDFSRLLATGETISAVSSFTASPSGLTIGSITHNSVAKAQARISGGTAETVYTVTVRVTTSDSNTREEQGKLRVV